MTERVLGIARFFGEVKMRLDDARQSDRLRYQQFFAELNPILDAVHKLERELDRHLANRFNVFDYMGEDRPCEALLSRILADLLNPNARHGQGTSLLQILLDELPAEMDASKLRPDFSKPVHVVLERVISQGRRIDVTVDLATQSGQWCLAIENKPFADDQYRQIIDYLQYLKMEYEDRFLLIYLSPSGAGPTDQSLPKEELLCWRGRFAVMPYWVDSDSAEREADCVGDDERALADDGGMGVDEGETGDDGNRVSGSEKNPFEDLFADFRTGFSLAEWFAACRTRCHADRLRWFFRDAEAFCRQQFGGRLMTTDSDTRAIQDYLFSNPNQLGTAQAVWDVWLDIKAALCGGFLEHVRTVVHERLENELTGIASDLHVECKYGGEKSWSNILWLYCERWYPWENHDQRHPPEKGRTAVVLQSQGRGPNRWRWGVLHPLGKSSMSSRDKERRTRLEERLRSQLEPGGSDSWWPYHRSVSDEMTNWDSLLPDLYREWKDSHGAIADYYVTGIVDIATKAIPAIDEVERTWGQAEPREHSE